MSDEREYWCGKPIDEMTRDELLAIVRQQARAIKRLHLDASGLASLFRLSHVRQAGKSHVPRPFRPDRR